MVIPHRARVRLDRIFPDGADPLAAYLVRQADHLCAALDDALDSHWGGGMISLSAYETAWVALVRKPDVADRLAFPAALHWLLRHQHGDGHWGDIFPHSVLPTLASLLALQRMPQPSARSKAAHARARAYLLQRLPAWDVAIFDTPLFELLVPALLAELDDPALTQAAPGLELMAARTRAKLEHVPLELVYQGQSPLIHGLEALGTRLDYARLAACQAKNGSFGNSPAATASVLYYGPHWNARAATWLEYLLGQHTGADRGGMPTSHPADIFEIAWACGFLQHGGYRLHSGQPAIRRLLVWLRASLTAQGVGFAHGRGLPPDVDDTAVVLTVLRSAGMQVPLDGLWHFAAGDHFVNYAGERTASSSANAHVLDALLTAGDGMAAEREHLSRYLLDQRDGDGCWHDKWHLSPYYATATCVLPLARMPNVVRRRDLMPTLTWLLDTCQGESWGMEVPTVEETAYAVLSLAAMADIVPASRRVAWQRALQAGWRFLAQQSASLAAAQLPSLWLDKTLYHSRPVVAAAVVSALHAAHIATSPAIARI